MIELSVHHPAFDMSLEMLCLLPRAGQKQDGARFGDLAFDLGFRKSGEVEIRFLMLAGTYSLKKYTCKGVKRMVVSEDGWEEARTAAQPDAQII